MSARSFLIITAILQRRKQLEVGEQSAFRAAKTFAAIFPGDQTQA
jgi:hypothetical protein